jgi:hypothetical protein
MTDSMMTVLLFVNHVLQTVELVLLLHPIVLNVSSEDKCQIVDVHPPTTLLFLMVH